MQQHNAPATACLRFLWRLRGCYIAVACWRARAHDTHFIMSYMGNIKKKPALHIQYSRSYRARWSKDARLWDVVCFFSALAFWDYERGVSQVMSPRRVMLLQHWILAR